MSVIHSTYHPCSARRSIQLAGAIGVSNCPGAPRLQFLFGRPAATEPAPDLTIPEPFGRFYSGRPFYIPDLYPCADSVDSILSRFSDAGFTTDQVVALLAS